MKKLLAVVLIAFLTGSLVACKQIDQPTTTTTTEKSSVGTTETSKPTVSTEKINESVLYSNAIEEVTDPAGYYFIHGRGDHFFFYDIDGDGIKEWLLGTDVNREKRRPEDGKDIYLRGISSIQDGVVMRQRDNNLELGEADVPPVVFKNGMIRCEDFRDDWGSRVIRYAYLEDGKLKDYTSLRKNDLIYAPFLENEYEYFVRDNNEYIGITEEEFEQMQKEIEGDGQTVELDWRPLAEWGQ